MLDTLYKVQSVFISHFVAMEIQLEPPYSWWTGTDKSAINVLF